MKLDSLVIVTCDDGSVELAQAELSAAASDAGLLEELSAGVLLCDAGIPFVELAARWRASPPIFVRHIAPVQVIAPLGGHAGDPAFLARALPDALPALDAALRFSVQTRILADVPYKPFDVNTTLASALAGDDGPALDVRAPQQIVSVACASLHTWQPDASLVIGGAHVGRGRRQAALAGLSLAANNLSSWAGGMRRFAREKGQVSRAEFKLLEAFEVFGVELPPRGVALDLGAAPGGWTRVLRQRGQYVTAVDPGELDAHLAGDRGVRHLRITAEQYLQDEPDSFDVIVNDMRMDARDSARLMAAFARFLYPHGWALMTLKLPEHDRQPVLDQAFAILRRAYRIAGARQLFHNRSEITVFLRRR
jgi:23S rRNA (cytidine2498-2'-O)-methyltransferase